MPNASRYAVVILHEIYGINHHIRREHDKWQGRGFDAYIPALFPHTTPFGYAQQDKAYRHFSENVGFDPTRVVALLTKLRAKYSKLLVVGYSVGATHAWLAARSDLCDGVICHYGSRIRQYSDIAPPCPALIIIARYEPSFDTLLMQQELEKLPLVQCVMFDTPHGFCDADSPAFNAELAHQASKKAAEFADTIISVKV
ncbi:Dienelactone hydrolase family [Yersinia frederiksenii]|nr:Dienelactone hydrolase family [Yersinia frederiksenii]CNH92888.1 Dienelactone hydrolase family [Yersinia frederiksenii]